MNSWEEKKAVEEMTKGTLIDTTRNCEINYSHVDTQTFVGERMRGTENFCWNCGARMDGKENEDAKIH